MRLTVGKGGLFPKLLFIQEERVADGKAISRVELYER